jgi:hypothetical protein
VRPATALTDVARRVDHRQAELAPAGVVILSLLGPDWHRLGLLAISEGESPNYGVVDLLLRFGFGGMHRRPTFPGRVSNPLASLGAHRPVFGDLLQPGRWPAPLLCGGCCCTTYSTQRSKRPINRRLLLLEIRNDHVNTIHSGFLHSQLDHKIITEWKCFAGWQKWVRLLSEQGNLPLDPDVCLDTYRARAFRESVFLGLHLITVPAAHSAEHQGLAFRLDTILPCGSVSLVSYGFPSGKIRPTNTF